MRAKLLHKAGRIDKGATVDVQSKTDETNERATDDCAVASTNSAPVYAITDEHGNTENVDTRDLKIVP